MLASINPIRSQIPLIFNLIKRRLHMASENKQMKDAVTILYASQTGNAEFIAKVRVLI